MSLLRVCRQPGCANVGDLRVVEFAILAEFSDLVMTELLVKALTGNTLTWDLGLRVKGGVRLFVTAVTGKDLSLHFVLRLRGGLQLFVQSLTGKRTCRLAVGVLACERAHAALRSASLVARVHVPLCGRRACLRVRTYRLALRLAVGVTARAGARARREHRIMGPSVTCVGETGCAVPDP